MPRQNRPLVRDGRIQPKKRTDRSYLRPAAAPEEAQASDTELEATAADDSFMTEPFEPAPVATPATAQRPARLTGSARALQQQGVRKRREIDLGALAVADTRYAFHELRRIAILATLIIVTLIVLAIVLR